MRAKAINEERKGGNQSSRSCQCSQRTSQVEATLPVSAVITPPLSDTAAMPRLRSHSPRSLSLLFPFHFLCTTPPFLCHILRTKKKKGYFNLLFCPSKIKGPAVRSRPRSPTAHACAGCWCPEGAAQHHRTGSRSVAAEPGPRGADAASPPPCLPQGERGSRGGWEGRPSPPPLSPGNGRGRFQHWPPPPAKAPSQGNKRGRAKLRSLGGKSKAPGVEPRLPSVLGERGARGA